MRPRTLVARALGHYWRTNVAVVVGVATAVAVLAGALLVGDSVRASLRALVLDRLGATDIVVVSPSFFREALAADLGADEGFSRSFGAAAPMVVVEAAVAVQGGSRRASRVSVYGVDERFWRFHDRPGAGWSEGDDRREALVSPALASDLGVAAGGAVIVRVERPSDVPAELVHGRKDDGGRALRLTVSAVAGAGALGEFSLRPQQGSVRAIFVPLRRLQRELDLAGRVNVLLVSSRAGLGERRSDVRSVRLQADSGAGLADVLRRTAALEDLGVTVRAIAAPPAVAVESPAGVLDASQTAAAERAAKAFGLEPRAVFTYLANTLRRGDREVPYSLVAAMDLSSLAAGLGVAPDRLPEPRPPIVLNDWTARDLGARVGDPLTLDYYAWEEPGRLATRSAEFRVAAVIPLQGAAADRDLAPFYPGISESERLTDWDPPFPIDLRRVRRVDEDYWKQYRTTPKAFVPLDVGQRLWRTRYGDRTSIRIAPDPGRPLDETRDRLAARLRAEIDPLAVLSVQAVRADGLAASRGSTDFGEYFTYFSFFLVASALLLAMLFFRLGVEQRAREVGLLRAVGIGSGAVRRMFGLEGMVLAVLGSLVGTAGAVGYAAIMMSGLGSWWRGAVGTDALALHVAPASLAGGAAGVVVAAVACVWWTLGGLSRLSERRLLAGQITADVSRGMTRRRIPVTLVAAAAFATTGLGVIAVSAYAGGDRAGAFFGASGALLAACLSFVAFALRRPARALAGRGWIAMARLGARNAADRPGRSVAAVAVIAAATFMLVSVDAFRRHGPPATDRGSGVGGYSLLVELLVPLVHDPNGPDGREALGLSGVDDVTVEGVRLLPGEDVSCLNLYEPRQPRILGVSREFIRQRRFAFQSSAAASGDERENPWLLLERPVTEPDVVPVVGDANSLAYVLHKALGDDILIDVRGRPVRLRIVAALADSVFQSELVMSESNFLKLFPDQGGYQVLLVEAPPGRVAPVADAIEDGGRALGADAISTADRLAEFHQVENTYISTFQALGGLGLLVGTIGLAAILLRNVLERRRDLALLAAVGYRTAHVFVLVLAENVMLLLLGLGIGAMCAVVAVLPAAIARGATPISTGGVTLVAGVFLAGLVSSVLATRAALRTPLLAALRAE